MVEQLETLSVSLYTVQSSSSTTSSTRAGLRPLDMVSCMTWAIVGCGFYGTDAGTLEKAGARLGPPAAVGWEGQRERVRADVG